MTEMEREILEECAGLSRAGGATVGACLERLRRGGYIRNGVPTEEGWDYLATYHSSDPAMSSKIMTLRPVVVGADGVGYLMPDGRAPTHKIPSGKPAGVTDQMARVALDQFFRVNGVRWDTAMIERMQRAIRIALETKG